MSLSIETTSIDDITMKPVLMKLYDLNLLNETSTELDARYVRGDRPPCAKTTSTALDFAGDR